MASKIMPTREVFNKTAILNTYRQLLRATYIAFKGTMRRMPYIFLYNTTNNNLQATRPL
jgi:hypothetical protein